jgi:3-hydroxyisobutyrate dehydrogenase-like beta-hydroxyacid dehydrogenase
MNERGTVGLIGLGLVGTSLAKRFAAAGFPLVGCDTEPACVDAFARGGGTPVDTPREVAERCRRTVLSLPTSREVVIVVEGDNGMAEGLRDGDVVIDTTTADPVESEALALRLAQRGVTFIDATIHGSSRQIAECDVIVTTGGDPGVVESCSDLFDTFARATYHMGTSGRGAETKLVVNLMLGLSRLALAEALALGECAGIDLETLLRVLKDSSAYSRVMDTKGEKMLRGDYAPEGRLAQHWKDVRLILDLAQRTGASLPLSELHERFLHDAAEAGYGDKDNSAVFEFLRRVPMEGTENSSTR